MIRRQRVLDAVLEVFAQAVMIDLAMTLVCIVLLLSSAVVL